MPVEQITYVPSQWLPTHPLPRRWHEAETLRQGGRDHAAPEGVFTDWTADDVRCEVYRLRTMRPQPTAYAIAEALDLQHGVRAYRAYDCWARRVARARTRGEHIEMADRDHRTFVRRRREDAIVSGYRTWGVELEFMHPNCTNDYYGSRDEGHRMVGDAIQALTLRAGVDLRSGDTGRWNAYGSADHSRWALTRDSTVSGEVVSPVGTQDSDFDDLRSVMAAMREAGARPAAQQGLHTNIGVGDFEREDRVRLVENLRDIDGHMQRYTPASRHGRSYSATLSANEWASAHEAIAAGRQAYCRSAYNFAHIEHANVAARRVEFRQFGHSLNFTKTRVWVQVCRAIVTATKAGHTFGVTDIDTFVAGMKDHGGLSDWAAARFLRRCGNTGQAIAA